MTIKELFKSACLEELQAIKPGNVHVFADGHGMTLEDFIKSADAASEAISAPDLSLGERILAGVVATQNAVHCNTNLGIILLCVPLIQAQHQLLEVVLKSTNNQDCALCFRAIALANPGGLGESAAHDVRLTPTCTLLQAMQEAAPHDLIAQQYANNFADIFEFGVPNFGQAIARWQNIAWATTDVYLHFLATYLDSHIVRKHGESLAKSVQKEAEMHLKNFDAVENPKTYLGELLRWDATLKARSINPGTCADLTVATLFATKLKAHIAPKVNA